MRAMNMRHRVSSALMVIDLHDGNITQRADHQGGCLAQQNWRTSSTVKLRHGATNGVFWHGEHVRWPFKDRRRDRCDEESSNILVARRMASGRYRHRMMSRKSTPLVVLRAYTICSNKYVSAKGYWSSKM